MRPGRGAPSYHSPASAHGSPLRYVTTQGSAGRQGPLFMERSRSAAVVLAPTGMVYCPRAPRWIVKAVRAIGVAGWGGGVWTHSLPRGRLETQHESSEEHVTDGGEQGTHLTKWSGLRPLGEMGASSGDASAMDVVVGLGSGGFGGSIMNNESFSWTLGGWRRSIREATEREDAKQLRQAFDREEMTSGYDTPTGGGTVATAAPPSTTPLDRRAGAGGGGSAASLASTLSLTTRSPWAIVGALAAWLEDRFFPLFGAEEAECIMAAAEGEIPRAIRTGASSASSVSGSLVDDETAANRRLHAALLRHGGMVRDKRIEALQYVLDQMIDPFCRAVLASFASAATDSAATLLGPLLFLYGHAYQAPREETRSTTDDDDHILLEEDSANMPRAIAALRILTELYSDLFAAPMYGLGRSRGNSSNALNLAGSASCGAQTAASAAAATPLIGGHITDVFSTNSANKTSSRGSLSDAGDVMNAFATRADLLTGLSEQNDPVLPSSLTTEPAATAAIFLSNTGAQTTTVSSESPSTRMAAAAGIADSRVRPQSISGPVTATSSRQKAERGMLSGPGEMVGTIPADLTANEGDHAALLERALARIETLEREVDFLNRELANYRDECVSGNRDLHNCVDAWTAIVLSETRSVAASERATIRSLARRLRKLERRVFGENAATGVATSPEHSVRGESLGAQRLVSGGVAPAPESPTQSIQIPGHEESAHGATGIEAAPAAARMVERRLLCSELSSDDPVDSQGGATSRHRSSERDRPPLIGTQSPTVAGATGAMTYLMSEHGSFGSDEDPLLVAFQRAVGLGSANGSGEDTGESAPSTPQTGTPLPGGLHGPLTSGLSGPAMVGSLPLSSGSRNVSAIGLRRSTSGSNVVRTASPMLADPLSGTAVVSCSLPATSAVAARGAAIQGTVASSLHGRHPARRILRDGKWITEEAAGLVAGGRGTGSASRASRREREAVLRRQIESMQMALEEERQRRRSLEERLAGHPAEA